MEYLEKVIKNGLSEQIHPEQNYTFFTIIEKNERND